MVKKLSIILPLFNEEKRLKNTFKEINIFKNSYNHNLLEIIFVNDGSSDSSQKLIAEFAKKNNIKKKFEVKNIFLHKNMGKGFALKKGIAKSSCPWVLTTDVDLSVPLSQIYKWNKQKLITKKSIIFGSRNLRNSKVSTKKYRYLLGKILNYLIKTILNIHLFDTQCGYKLYAKQSAKYIFSKLTNHGFAHDLEIVLIAKKKNFNIKELPVKWTHKKGSKLNIFYDPFKMFLSIILLRVKYFS